MEVSIDDYVPRWTELRRAWSTSLSIPPVVPTGMMPPPSEVTLTSSNQPHRKRNLMKCLKCRADKKHCEPVDRDWDISHERCKRCERLDHTCGPPEKKSWKRKSLLFEKTSQPREEHNTASSKAVLPNNEDRASSEEAQPSQSDRTDCCSLTYSERVSSLADSDSWPNRCPFVRMVPMTLEYRNESITSIRGLLVELQDLLGTINLLRLHQQLCNTVESWTDQDFDTSSHRSITFMIDALKQKTTRLLQQAKTSIHRHSGFDKELYLERLCSINEKYVDLVSSSVSDFHGQRSKGQHPRLTLANRDRRTLYDIQSKAGSVSTLYYLYGQTVNILTMCPLSPAGNDSDLVEDHLTASKAVTKVISLLREECRQSVQDGHPAISHLPLFTPCHLAALQSSPTVLLDLWQQCDCVWEVDFLNRTPVHMAAYAGNLTVLTLIIEIDSTTAANADLDYFSMSPLMIAACKDDLEGFELLLKNGANDKVLHRSGRSLLALAARSGSTKVVKHFLGGTGPFPFSPLPPLSEAILARRLDITVLFVEYYRRPRVDIDDIEIQHAIKTATVQGLHDLVLELEYLMKNRLHPQVAVQAFSGDWDRNHQLTNVTGLDLDLIYLTNTNLGP